MVGKCVFHARESQLLNATKHEDKGGPCKALESEWGRETGSSAPGRGMGELRAHPNPRLAPTGDSAGDGKGSLAECSHAQQRWWGQCQGG